MVDLAYLYNVASSLSGSYPLFSSDALSKMQNVQVTPSGIIFPVGRPTNFVRLETVLL